MIIIDNKFKDWDKETIIILTIRIILREIIQG